MNNANVVNEGEVWLPVVGYEGFYEVSNLARVRSADRLTVNKNGVPLRLKGIMMRQLLSTHGYYRVRLSLGGKAKGFSTHRLAAIAFIPNPDNKPFINHINGIKTDNRLENLEWCTLLENNQHARETGLCNQTGVPRPDILGSGNGRAILTEADVRYIRANQHKITAQALADKFGVKKKYVYNLQYRKKWKHLA